MTISQKFQIGLLRTLVMMLWLLDYISVGTLAYIGFKYKKIVMAFVIVVTGGLLVYSFSNSKALFERSPVIVTDGINEVLGAADPVESSGSITVEEVNITETVTEEKKEKAEDEEKSQNTAQLTQKPELSARSVLAKNLKTDEVLFEKNSRLILAPASTTKLMTAIVALEKYQLNDELEVSEECTLIESTKAWFPAKSKFKVIDLLYAMLVSSAGDAACALADGKGSYDEFIAGMNTKSKELGMKNTYFTNEIGLDGYASSHYSTAEDLYVLAKEAAANETIQEIVKTKSFVINSLTGDFTYSAQNTNQLLWEVEGTVGIKTGTTFAAGEVLVYEYKKDEKDFVIIVMGSVDRFNDTKLILNWILENYSEN